MHEAFRTADFGDRYLAGKSQGLWPRGAQADDVGAESHRVVAIGDLRECADRWHRRDVAEPNLSAGLDDRNFVQWRIGKDASGFDVARPVIDFGRRPKLNEASLPEGCGIAAELERLKRFGRCIDERGARLRQ